MKRFLALICIAGGALLSSCQCSDKPPVPPVEDAAARIGALHEARRVGILT